MTTACDLQATICCIYLCFASDVLFNTVARDKRSLCPISYSLDQFGDRWTLLILRDLILFRKRHYREFLDSGEGISTNILADRLGRLEKSGMIRKERDPLDGKRFLYSATNKGEATLPILLEMVAWGAEYDPNTPISEEFRRRVRTDREALAAEILERGVKANPES